MDVDAKSYTRKFLLFKGELYSVDLMLCVFPNLPGDSYELELTHEGNFILMKRNIQIQSIITVENF